MVIKISNSQSRSILKKLGYSVGSIGALSKEFFGPDFIKDKSVLFHSRMLAYLPEETEELKKCLREYIIVSTEKSSRYSYHKNIIFWKSGLGRFRDSNVVRKLMVPIINQFIDQ